MNNLYGYAMSTFLLTSGFKWINTTEFDLNKHTNNSSKGCVLEVNLEYPKELRKLHSDYPLAPDKMLLLFIKKLVPKFFDKEKYVLHYENLQLVRLGLKLQKYIPY